MLLSIVVISHNQREQLKRCIDSILAQKIPFEYEVLISDDASNDGSYELAKEYERRYPVIHAFTVNTDDYNPTNKSFRSGINRCNALKHATGKYIAHIDGDDFLLADSKIYEKQVKLLEQHQECSCCMANDYTLIDGDGLEAITIRHPEPFDTGQILKKEDYIRNYFRESHCFVYRRNDTVNPIDLLGGYYVDNCITAFYVQFGDIVCLNDVGYVYVQYSTSIWHDYMKTNDYIVLSCPALFCAGLIPALKPIYWSHVRHLSRMKEVVEVAIEEKPMTESTLRWMSRFDYYLFHAFNRKLRCWDKIHLESIKLLLGIMKRIKRRHPRVPVLWRLLDAIL